MTSNAISTRREGRSLLSRLPLLCLLGLITAAPAAFPQDAEDPIFGDGLEAGALCCWSSHMGSSQQLVVTQAVASVDSATLLVHGTNFGTTDPPDVFLGTVGGSFVSQVVTSSTDEFIVAELNILDPGTYQLIVSTGTAPTQMWVMDLTIGAVGPAGEPGQDGADGADGLHCWDANANGTCDPATEDTDENGVCDVGDCQGPPGPGGILNGFDSGWMPVGRNQDYVLQHNLGTTAVVASIWFSKNSSGTDRFYGPSPLSWREHNPEFVSGVTIVEMDATTVKIRTGNDFRIPTTTPGSDGHEILSSGYARITLLAVREK